MIRTTKITVTFLCFSAVLGFIRGIRMVLIPEGDAILFSYPKEAIELSVFSSYAILGWVILLLVGAFSMLTLLSYRYRPQWFAYMTIMEGIFVTCLAVLNIVVAGFSLIHLLFSLPIGVGLIVAGILLAPREF